MTLSFITQQRSQRLILIYAGWAMDAMPFMDLHCEGYDIAVAYDHRQPADSKAVRALGAYSEICVIAWSFGVIAATGFMLAHPSLPLTARIAVNGTLHPVHDTMGIPTAIFKGTLHSLSETVLEKFDRRMCSNRRDLSRFLASGIRRRDIPLLADELRAISSMPPMGEHAALWDTVYIGRNDLIIPTANQIEAWEGHPDVRSADCAHLPDFQWIIDHAIINKALVALRFRTSAATYHTLATVQRDTACALAESIAGVIGSNPVADALEVGSGTGLLTREIVRTVSPVRLMLWDIAPIPDSLPGIHRQCDAEAAAAQLPDHSLDLIASASTIQWFNSPATFIRQCRRALRPGGLLALSTFGPDNFAELKPFISTPLHYPDAARWEKMLAEAGFSHIDITESRRSLTFPSSADLLRHIRQTGVNALSQPASVASARAILHSGITTLTYHPLCIIAR